MAIFSNLSSFDTGRTLKISLPALVFAGTGLLLLWTAVWKYLTNGLRHVPGPWHTRITNIAWKKAKFTGRRLHYIHALHQRYGDTVRICPDSVSISDVKSHKTIHAIPSSWIKSKYYVECFKAPSIGVFAQPDPKIHAQRRRLLAPRFTKSSLRDLWEPTVREQIELATAKIVNEAKAKGTVDLLKWFTFMYNDIGAILMFGESFGQVEAGVESEYITILKQVLMSHAMAYEIPLIGKISHWLPFNSIFNMHGRMLEYGAKAVNNAREGATTRNIFHNIIAKSADSDTGLSDLDVHCEATSLLIGASDTTAASLAWIVWAVMRRPLIRTSLETELKTLPANFSDADLEKLPYLNAVISESMRLYGAGCGSLPRVVPQGGAVLNGYALPAGIDVQSQAYTLHRRADVWENPLSFDPSRFLRPQTSDQSAVYIPFGAGARSCIGIHLAQMDLRYGTALVMLAAAGNAEKGVRRLELAPSLKDEDMELQDYFLVVPVGHKCEVREVL